MGLSQNNGQLTLGGDSSGAVKALNDTKTASNGLSKDVSALGGNLGSMAAKLTAGGLAAGAFAGALLVAKASAAEFIEAHKASADLFSQFGDLGFGGAQMATAIQDSADGMIKIQTAAKSMNVLVRSEIGATVQEVQSLSKASVDIARKMGGNADQIMEALTTAVASGKTKGLKQYGILINETTVEIDAHVQALEKYGQTANENDIKLMTSRNILQQINGTYQDTIISVGDVNEIEAKYQNERSRNMAISAKYSEEAAKKIVALKHSWQDVKDSVTDYFNQIEHDTKRAKDLISSDAKRQIQDYKVEFFWALEEVFGKANDALPFHAQMEIFTRQATMTANELGQRIEFQFKTQKNITDAELKRLDDETFKSIKVNEALKEKARLALQFARDQHGVSSEEAQLQEQLLDALDQRGKKLEGIKQQVTDQRLYQLAEDGLKRVDTVIKETNEYLISNTLKLGDYQKMNKDQLSESAKKSENQAVQVKRQLDYYESLKKLGKDLTTEQKAHLNVLVKQSKEIETQQDLMTSVMELLFGGKKASKPAQSNGQIESWRKEFEQYKKLIAEGDSAILDSISKKFGTLNSKEIESWYRRENNEVEKLRRKIREERSTEQAKQAEDEGHEQQQIMERVLRNEMDFYQKRIDALKNESSLATTSERQKLDINKKIEQELITQRDMALAAAEGYFDKQEEIRNEFSKKLGDNGRERLQIEAKIESDSLANQKKANDEKRKEQEKHAQDLKEAWKKLGDELKETGDQMLRSSAGSMYDAMTMSRKAMEEEGLSRKQVLLKGLKDTADSIAKEAYIRSLMEVAYGIAAYATGNPKAGVHFAAALAFGAVSGAAYATGASISVPSGGKSGSSESSGSESITNKKTEVSGTSGGSTKVINVYFPSGFIMGDKDGVVKMLRTATDEAERRGQL